MDILPSLGKNYCKENLGFSSVPVILKGNPVFPCFCFKNRDAMPPSFAIREGWGLIVPERFKILFSEEFFSVIVPDIFPPACFPSLIVSYTSTF